MLTDADKERIKSIATGHVINSTISIEDQIAAIREQLMELSIATNTQITPKFKKFNDEVTKCKR